MHPFNPNGLFDLGARAMAPANGDEVMSLIRDAPLADAPAIMPCWRRRAAWINTAGSFDVTWCVDARGSLIHRDAGSGTLYAWNADPIVPQDQGGADVPCNLRALSASRGGCDGDWR